MLGVYAVLCVVVGIGRIVCGPCRMWLWIYGLYGLFWSVIMGFLCVSGVVVCFWCVLWGFVAVMCGSVI